MKLVSPACGLRVYETHIADGNIYVDLNAVEGLGQPQVLGPGESVTGGGGGG